MSLRLYDAHNHLQDDRFGPHRDSLVPAARQEGVVKMVVNGSGESDWPAVLELARNFQEVVPSFGVHPWYVAERSARWQDKLQRHLDQLPSAIGEIGLDRWIKDYDLEQQEDAFVWQWRLAAERNVPVSIHCLQAWGRLLEILRTEPGPVCGFVLHSFGGPAEMIPELTKFGAYFSFPGYFANERKGRQRETFRHVPGDRLLVETDAPDQLLPPEREDYTLADPESGKPLNHPANLGAVYRYLAEFLGQPLESVAAQVEQNFLKTFGKVLSKA
jgi:TatD DNase family protein